MTNRRRFKSNRGETVCVRFERGFAWKPGKDGGTLDSESDIYFTCAYVLSSVLGVQNVEIVARELFLCRPLPGVTHAYRRNQRIVHIPLQLPWRMRWIARLLSRRKWTSVKTACRGRSTHSFEGCPVPITHGPSHISFMRRAVGKVGPGRRTVVEPANLRLR